MGIIESIFRAKAEAATALRPGLAGAPYRPGSGTEGMAFDDAWCSRCARDAEYRAQGDDGDPAIACRILSDSLLYDLAAQQYPKEWVYDRDGRPSCTAFTTDPKQPLRCDKTIDMFETPPRPVPEG